jgi:Rrf2 family protein
MKITNKGKYAVRAMLYIACSNHLVSVKEVAKDEELSSRYLEQIFFSLKKSGLVKSKKGPNGGYSLARNDSKITVGDILKAVEDKETSIIDKYDNQNLNVVIQKEVWDKVEERIEEVLGGITLDKLRNKYYERSVNMYYI